ncbi:MAG TPA: MCP four helix bundle domain-containing protein, partial [Tepidiformaceae bacterium]|nr:MCP four helix bundle domain-containing protein [Tepidiformaceae bacterium]
MSWFNNLSIQVKLLAGFGAVLALTAIVASVGILRLNELAHRSSEAYTLDTLGLQYANQVNRNMIGSGSDQQSAILNAADPAKRDAAIAASTEQMERAKVALKDYYIAFEDAEDEKHWHEVEDLVNRVITERLALFELLKAGDVAGATAAAGALGPVIAEMNAEIDSTIAHKLEEAGLAADANESAAASARTLVLVVTGIAVLLGVVIAFYLARRVKSDVNAVRSRLESLQQHCLTQLESAMAGLASGDLTLDVTPVTQKIPNPGKDELGQMAATTNDIIDKMVRTIGAYKTARVNLTEIVNGVQGSANSILVASDQLQEASDQMAAATGQIATAINEVTRSAVSLAGLSQDSAKEIEGVAAGSRQLAAAAIANSNSAADSSSEASQMHERIAQVAAASEDVARSAEESRVAALAGQEAVQQAVGAMESIASAVATASSTVNQLGGYGEQIGDIVKAIDEIPAPTNLL